jgi:hypothetical protein
MEKVQSPSNSEGFACLQIAALFQTANVKARGAELNSAALCFLVILFLISYCHFHIFGLCYI